MQYINQAAIANNTTPAPTNTPMDSANDNPGISGTSMVVGALVGAIVGAQVPFFGHPVIAPRTI